MFGRLLRWILRLWKPLGKGPVGEVLSSRLRDQLRPSSSAAFWGGRRPPLGVSSDLGSEGDSSAHDALHGLCPRAGLGPGLGACPATSLYPDFGNLPARGICRGLAGCPSEGPCPSPGLSPSTTPSTLANPRESSLAPPSLPNQRPSRRLRAGSSLGGWPPGTGHRGPGGRRSGPGRFRG